MVVDSCEYLEIMMNNGLNMMVTDGLWWFIVINDGQ